MFGTGYVFLSHFLSTLGISVEKIQKMEFCL